MDNDDAPFPLETTPIETPPRDLSFDAETSLNAETTARTTQPEAEVVTETRVARYRRPAPL